MEVKNCKKYSKLLLKLTMDSIISRSPKIYVIIENEHQTICNIIHTLKIEDLELKISTLGDELSP